MPFMSYKALLFCPDEKTARAVTQVLSELDFTVERAGEPFGTVKKLTDQHFDALVVDCQNEQDASLLFKSARNSTFNHSSLSVAVVEGQAGVAKAFRIGANLVLTKPINVEQSKSTLRVARGLLKKTEAKAAAATAGSTGVQESSSLFASKLVPAPTPAPLVNSSPFSSLEVEEEPAPATEAAEAAVLESLPDPIKPASSASQVFAPALKNSAEPIAASTSRHSGAAAAPALARAPLEIRTAPPMATHDAVGASEFSQASEISAAPVPTFASYSEEVKTGSGKKIFSVAAILLVVAGLAYVAVRRPQLFQNLHRSGSSEPATAPAPPVAAPAASSPGLPVESKLPETEMPTSSLEVNPVTPASKPLRTAPIETIQVDQTGASQDGDVTVEAKPLIVNTKPSTVTAPKAAPAAPAPPTISAEGDSAGALADLVTTNTTIPKAAPQSVRISQGVSQGLLIRRVSPVYPSIALQLRKQGSVDLLASINKDGDITKVQVLSGDSLLAKAAADAVRQWKYRPYLLNGLPVEIETQITVNFKLPR